MIDNHQTTPPNNYTSSGELWGAIEQLQNDLAHQLRRHEAGKQIDATQLLQAAKTAIERTLGAAAETADPIDYSIRDLIAGYWAHVGKRRENAPTGFAMLNEMLGGGIETQRLVVLLGAPNCGKTTFVHQMADSIANSGRPVLYVTTEDSPYDLLAKTLSRIGGVNYTAVKKGWESERARINAALAMQLDRPSSDRLRYLDATSGVTLATIKEKAQAHFADYPRESGVMVVDYLQRVARAAKMLDGLPYDLREVVSHVTEQLRAMACELDCGMVVVASQNRASGYSTANSALASAKESGDIEYTADVIMALGEDTERRASTSFLQPMVLRIDKNRQGSKDRKLAFDFQGDRQLFTEVQTRR